MGIIGDRLSDDSDRGMHDPNNNGRRPPAKKPEPRIHTEEWWDMLHTRKDRINKRLDALMEEETADLSPAMDEALRTQLTEETRFWR